MNVAAAVAIGFVVVMGAGFAAFLRAIHVRDRRADADTWLASLTELDEARQAAQAEADEALLAALRAAEDRDTCDAILALGVTTDRNTGPREEENR